MRYAQQSIAHIRATAYYELVAACLIRSELEEAESHLADLVSFVRTPIEPQSPQTSLWDQYASRITLLYGHLAHALGQSHRALECYQTVCLLENEESTMWAMGKVGEIVLRIGAAALRAEAQGKETNIDTAEDQKDDQQLWVSGERERLMEMAAGLVERCLDGGLGQHLAVVGRLVAASLSSEIIRAKYGFPPYFIPPFFFLTKVVGRISRAAWTYHARVATIISDSWSSYLLRHNIFILIPTMH